MKVGNTIEAEDGQKILLDQSCQGEEENEWNGRKGTQQHRRG